MVECVTGGIIRNGMNIYGNAMMDIKEVYRHINVADEREVSEQEFKIGHRWYTILSNDLSIVPTIIYEDKFGISRYVFGNYVIKKSVVTKHHTYMDKTDLKNIFSWLRKNRA